MDVSHPEACRNQGHGDTPKHQPQGCLEQETRATTQAEATWVGDSHGRGVTVPEKPPCHTTAQPWGHRAAPILLF